MGATPGVTKATQEIQLDKHIKLLDSPGIVMATGPRDPAAIILRNCIKVNLYPRSGNFLALNNFHVKIFCVKKIQIEALAVRVRAHMHSAGAAHA